VSANQAAVSIGVEQDAASKVDQINTAARRLLTTVKELQQASNSRADFVRSLGRAVQSAAPHGAPGPMHISQRYDAELRRAGFPRPKGAVVEPLAPGEQGPSQRAKRASQQAQAQLYLPRSDTQNGPVYVPASAPAPESTVGPSQRASARRRRSGGSGTQGGTPPATGPAPAPEKQAKQQTGLLERIANAVSWLGPQSLYAGQGAASAFGLTGGPQLAIMGAVAAAGLPLMLNTMFTDALKGSVNFQALVGTAPAAVGTEPSLAASQTVPASAYLYGLKQDQAKQVATGLAQGGVDVQQGTGPAIESALQLVAILGAGTKDAVQIVQEAMTQLGFSADATARQMSNLALVAEATGAPAASLTAIMAATPNLQALPGGGADVTAAFKQTLGSDELAKQFAGFLTDASLQGQARVANAAGVSIGQVNALQGSAQGQAQLLDATLARFQSNTAQLGQANAITQLSAITGGQIDLSHNLPEAEHLLRIGTGSTPSAQANLARITTETTGRRIALSGGVNGPLSPEQQMALGLAGPANVRTPHSVTEDVGAMLSGLGTLVNAGLGDATGHPAQFTPAQLQTLAQEPGPIGGIFSQMLQNLPASSQRRILDPATLQQAAAAQPPAPAPLHGEVIVHLQVDRQGNVVYPRSITAPIANGAQPNYQLGPKPPQ